MFEIRGDDVALPNDGDLRALIALLCEAELRSSAKTSSGAAAIAMASAASDPVIVVEVERNDNRAIGKAEPTAP